MAEKHAATYHGDTARDKAERDLERLIGMRWINDNIHTGSTPADLARVIIAAGWLSPDEAAALRAERDALAAKVARVAALCDVWSTDGRLNYSARYVTDLRAILADPEAKP